MPGGSPPDQPCGRESQIAGRQRVVVEHLPDGVEVEAGPGRSDAASVFLVEVPGRLRAFGLP
jgi:hypothetical protein